MWNDLLWPWRHINVGNMLTDVLYVERLQEVDVRQEHKGMKGCK